MPGVPFAPRRVFGVHVAALDEATHQVWVCRAHPGNDGIRVESIERLVDLPGGSPDPAAARDCLVGKIRDAPRSAWGFDAPFGGPADGKTVRKTERERDLGAAPPARGVWMQELLGQLRACSRVCVLPMQQVPIVAAGMPPAMASRAASTYLLEVHPGLMLARLRAEGLKLDDTGTSERSAALRELASASVVRPMHRSIRQRTTGVDHAAALGALLSAVAVWRGYRGYEHGLLHADADYRAEGFVYC